MSKRRTTSLHNNIGNGSMLYKKIVLGGLLKATDSKRTPEELNLATMSLVIGSRAFTSLYDCRQAWSLNCDSTGAANVLL